MNAEIARKRGRPHKPDGTKRANLTFRVRASDRDRLRASADDNGRSLSEEVEARILGSLLVDTLAARFDRIEALLTGGAR